MSDLGSHDNDVPYTVLDLWRPTEGRQGMAPLSVESTSPNVPVRAQGARAGDDDGDV